MKQILAYAFALLLTFGQLFSQQFPQIQHKDITINLNSRADFSRVTNTVTHPSGLSAASASGALMISQDMEVPVKNAEPFLAFGYVIEGESMSRHDFSFSIQYSSDKSSWSDWMRVNVDEDMQEQEGTFSGNLAFLPKNTVFFRYRIDFHPVNMQSALIKGLKISFISPGATPASVKNNLQKSAAQALTKETLNPVDGIYPRPAYVDRAGWGCPWGNGNPNFSDMVTTTVTHLVIHHSATENTASDWAAVVRTFWDWHVNSNKWSDIGYNWLVDPNGVLYQGRAWKDGNEDTQGAHFSSKNGATMGTCIMGDFTSIKPTEKALRTASKLQAYKVSKRGIDPMAISYHTSTQKNLYNICGHRDGGATECPGNMLYDYLSDLRSRINALVNPPFLATDSASVVSDTLINFFAKVNPRKSKLGFYIKYGASESMVMTTGVKNLAFNKDSLIVFPVSKIDTARQYYYKIYSSSPDSVYSGDMRVFDYSTFVSVGSGTSASAAGEFRLGQNYPNPFNPVTVISFSLPSHSTVSLEIFNTLGEKVRTLINGDLYNAGSWKVTWDGKDNSGCLMSSGVYLYRLSSGRYSASGKMILQK